MFWFFAGILGLFLLIALAIQLPPVQNFVKDRALTYLHGKLETTVDIGRVNISFPRLVRLDFIYIEDQKGDTLWYSERLYIDIKLFGLLRNKVDINTIELENARLNISRTGHDGVDGEDFNFSFIIHAFADTVKVKEDKEPSDREQDVVISLNRVILQDVNFTMNDALEGMEIDALLGSLELKMDELDLEKNVFMVDALDIRNAKVHMVSHLPSVEEETAEIVFNTGVNTLNLENIGFVYDDRSGGSLYDIHVAEASLRGEEFNLPEKYININSFALRRADVIIQLPATGEVPGDATEVIREIEEVAHGWVIAGGGLHLEENSLTFRRQGVELNPGMVDFDHLVLQNINADIDNILYSSRVIQADVQHLTLREQSGFMIQEFSTSFYMDENRAELQQMELITGNSSLSTDVSLSYTSMQAFSDDLPGIGVELSLPRATVNMRDLLYFDPSLAQQQGISPQRTLHLSADVSGEIGNLLISGFHARTGAATSLQLRGNIRGLPDAENAWYNLRVQNFATNSGDVHSLVPAGTIPGEITLPGHISASGNFRGTFNKFETDLKAITTAGNLSARVTMDASLQGAEVYDADIRTEGLNLGMILQQDEMLGTVTLEASIQGTGFDPETMSAEIEAVINEAIVNDYTYNNLVIDGFFRQQVFTGKAVLDDENLAFTYNGTVSFTEDNPVYRFTFKLEGADLRALNFTEDEIAVSGILEANITGTNMDNIEGDIAIRDVLVVKDEEIYPVKQFLFASVREEAITELSIKADFITAHFRGNINLGELPEVIRLHVNQYFTLHEVEISDELEHQNFTFNIDLHDSRLLTEVLLPDLHELNVERFTGSYNSRNYSLVADISIPHLRYADFTTRNLQADIGSNRERLNYSFRVDELLFGENLIPNPVIEGEISDNRILVNTRVRSDEGDERLLIAGVFTSLEEVYRFNLTGFALNEQQWTVPENNFVEIGGDYLYVENLQLLSGEQHLRFNSRERAAGAPLEISIRSFNLAELATILENDDYQVIGGMVNGDVVLENLMSDTTLAFTSDLKISDFLYRDYLVGNINLRAGQTLENIISINAGISGNGNDVVISGTYTVAEEASPLNLTMAITALNMASLEGFTRDHITRLGGTARGNLSITGTTLDPSIRGELHFPNAAFNLEMLESYFRLEQQRLVFDDRGIHFPSFTLMDTLNNRAVIDGRILTTNYRNFAFNLNVSTRDFLALNTTQADNELFFGTLRMNSDIRVRGDENLPLVNATINILDGSDFTFVIPEDDLAVLEREGIVVFVNPYRDLHEIMEGAQEGEDTVRTVPLTGIQLTAVVNITPVSRLNIVVDPVAGDVLQLRGQSSLNVGMDPAGTVTVSGRYEIQEGSYQLSFHDFARREFEIEQGSHISFSGDPLQASINITAIHETRTSAYELIRMQMGDADFPEQELQSLYLFQVHLNMSGELMTPEIEFEIQLAPQDRGAMGGTIHASLMQLNEMESELNKQVFSLLVLGRFMQPDPLAGTESAGISGVARASVSRLLTQQLNRIAGRYLPGTQVDFQLDTYRDPGAGDDAYRSVLNVALQQQLFNDRLTIQVGGDVDLEGERRRETGWGNIAGDFSATYNITPDARYRLRAYRRTEYESIVGGEFIESGIALIYARDFRSLTELFRWMNGNGNRVEQN